MPWTKLDDLFHAHPKVLRAWAAHRGSVGLHAMALSHAGAYLTDGHIDEAWVKTQLPSAAERRRVVDALVDAGLWDRAEGGWTIHGFLDCNQSREQILARRTAEPLAGARAPAPPGARTRARIPARPTPDLFPSAG